MLVCCASCTIKCTQGHAHKHSMAARYIMPTPVPRAQPMLPSRLCLGVPAALLCFGFCLGAGGMAMTVSLPCRSTASLTPAV